MSENPVYIQCPGPHPASNAVLRGQMEWGQGDRGAAGYYDHGGSELSMDSGSLLRAFDERWSGAPQPGVAIPAAVEIPVAEWPAFCAWFTENFRSVVVCLERQDCRLPSWWVRRRKGYGIGRGLSHGSLCRRSSWLPIKAGIKRQKAGTQRYSSEIALFWQTGMADCIRLFQVCKPHATCFTA
jgi:hypothetical protein